MALYFFGFALSLLPLALLLTAFQAAFRLARHGLALRRARFSVSAREARPGDTVEVRAEVVPRAGRSVSVEARLTCTMFDHRAHEIYGSSRSMSVADGDGGGTRYHAALTIPAYALRTGRVGDRSPNPLAEKAHRMLVVWTVDFAVRSARGALLCRQSRALQVPRGRRLETHFRRLSLIAVDTFSATRNDMLFNWLVHLAACDGAIEPAEMGFLSELLVEMEGMTDLELCGQRVEWERQGRLAIDEVFLRRYVTLDQRLEFYRALYTLARVDGSLDVRERQFLDRFLVAFGVGEGEVRPIEGEVEAARAAQPATP